jgi:N-acetylglucosaminyldiphosphoundecaprenol N-acetyl-beta-D-mannosaminyltransferase
MSRLQLGNIKIDTFTQNEALQAIELLHNIGGGTVFTPNVDHVMLAETNAAFINAYQKASIKLADGMPIVWASHLLGTPISERVAGSDLLMPLLWLAFEKGWKVFFLGSSSKTIIKALHNIEKTVPWFQVVGHLSPTVSEQMTDQEVQEIMEYPMSCKPDLVIVALGAPKQEIFISKAHQYLPKSVMIGLGASLDFIAGDVPRAPQWMQKIGLEWCWRLLREPRRLFARYLRDLKFPLVVWRQLMWNRQDAKDAT